MSETVNRVIQMLRRSEHAQRKWAQLDKQTKQRTDRRENKNRPGLMTNMRRCTDIQRKVTSPFEEQNQYGVLFNLLKEDEQWTVHETLRAVRRTLWQGVGRRRKNDTAAAQSDI